MTNVIGGEAHAGQLPDASGHAARASADRGAPAPDGSADAVEPSEPGGLLSTLAAVFRSGLGALAELVHRIVKGISAIAPLALGLACQSTNDAVAVAPPVVTSSPAIATEPPPTETGPRQLGQFTITFYYVVGEDEVATKAVAANENHGSEADGTELAAITPDLVTLYAGGGACEPIAEVSKPFAQQLAVQGTGKLRDGRVINIWGACNCKHTPCFKVTQAQWGTAGTGRPLQPFRTVAVDPKVVKLGSLLYVPLLEGRTMPGRQPWGGYVHDGCVIADDTGGHIAGNRLDLFVGRRAYFLGLSGSGGSHHWARHVPVFDGTQICERKGRHVGRKTGAI
jgi:3D (Asp-Asp-Asp) domain-containing protein